jgi:hypothetical protein
MNKSDAAKLVWSKMTTAQKSKRGKVAATKKWQAISATNRKLHAQKMAQARWKKQLSTT